MAGLGLLGIGYIMGSLQGPGSIFAADDKPAPKAGAKKDKEAAPANPLLTGLSEEAITKLKAVSSALKAAQDQLRLERKEGFTAVTKGINGTSILVGGLDTRRDLETGQGVDPETFAALYANMANDDILPNLQRNQDGLLEYKQKIIRMYSIERLRKLYQYRAVITGEEVPLTEEEKAAKEREDKAAGKAPAPKKEAPAAAPEKKDAEKKE